MEYADGVFGFSTIAQPITLPSNLDNRKSTRVFGLEFKSYEDQVASVAEHYLELIGEK
jgi:hypothetical protein